MHTWLRHKSRYFFMSFFSQVLFIVQSSCVLQSNQSTDMDVNTKMYRQAIFKLDHVQRKDSAQSS